MIVRAAHRPTLKLNEMLRLQPTLAGLFGICTLDLLTPLGIAEWIGYAISPWYVSCFSLTFVTLPRIELITDAALPLMLRHQTYSSNLLLKQGTL